MRCVLSARKTSAKTTLRSTQWVGMSLFVAGSVKVKHLNDSSTASPLRNGKNVSLMSMPDPTHNSPTVT